MTLACLLVAGVVQATLPGPEFTLAWTHSVQKSRWEERYRVEAEGLRLVEARIEGSGAGMEPPLEAQRHGNGWRWTPNLLVPAVTLAASSHGGDYRICTAAGCRALDEIVPGDRPVELRRCSRP
jgi:hypothetical protein